MARYVALLRGINLGKRRIKMEDLRACFAAMGFADVTTYIASGNVVFDAPEPPDVASIEAGLRATFGYAVPVALRTAAEIRAVAATNPFAGEALDAAAKRYVCFLFAEPGAAGQAAMAAQSTESDTFTPKGRELYVLCRKGTNLSIFSDAFVEKHLGVSGTTRNMTTVAKLAALVGDRGRA